MFTGVFLCLLVTCFCALSSENLSFGALASQGHAGFAGQAQQGSGFNSGLGGSGFGTPPMYVGQSTPFIVNVWLTMSCSIMRNAYYNFVLQGRVLFFRLETLSTVLRFVFLGRCECTMISSKVHVAHTGINKTHYDTACRFIYNNNIL